MHTLQQPPRAGSASTTIQEQEHADASHRCRQLVRLDELRWLEDVAVLVSLEVTQLRVEDAEHAGSVQARGDLRIEEGQLERIDARDTTTVIPNHPSSSAFTYEIE